jgi:TolA-binding protein
MANDGRCNCNNGDNNNIESPPSMLEQLFIVQAQLHRIVQQLLVQMQDVNQLMQSMESRPSSRKRKSNTLNDVSLTQKINATKKAAPSHKEGSTSAKATTTCFNCGPVGHFANRCPDRHQCHTPTQHPNRSQATTVLNQV